MDQQSYLNALTPVEEPERIVFLYRAPTLGLYAEVNVNAGEERR